MRSSKQVLLNRLEKRTGNHEERLKALGIEAPEEYTCAIHYTAMDNPVNINPPGFHEPIYLEQNTVRQLPFAAVNILGTPLLKHIPNTSISDNEKPALNDDGQIIHRRLNPFNNVAITHELVVCTEWQNIIATYVFIKEMRAHLQLQEANRQVSLVSLEQVGDDQFDPSLLLMHTHEIVLAQEIPLHKVPQRFFCAFQKHRIMTLPVRIDGNKVVDFYILLDQPKPEEFKDSPHIYFDPFTGQPLQCIDTEYALLEEIDEFISHSSLQDQVDAVIRSVARNNRHLDALRPAIHDLTFEQVLLNVEFPKEMIPTDLCLFNPGANAATIFKHPLLLDGLHPVDYDELMKFWKQKRDNWGVNPWTGKRIKSITYDENLREDIVQFIVNVEFYKTNPYKRRNRDHAKNGWGFNPGGQHKFTVGFGMYNQRAPKIGLMELGTEKNTGQSPGDSTKNSHN